MMMLAQSKRIIFLLDWATDILMQCHTMFLLYFFLSIFLLLTMQGQPQQKGKAVYHVYLAPPSG
jgi:hypothetical protein